MSTDKSNTIAKRFVILAKMGEVIFHTQDLGTLWQINNKNNLYTTLKRYTKRGLLFRIQKGLYSLKEIKDLDPVLLGVKSLNEFSYLSTETVLFENGIIFQIPSSITLISSKSRKFSFGENFYRSRKLNDKFLFNTEGIYLKNGVHRASIERAVADLLYFNPKYFFDGARMLDWVKIRKIQKNIGYI